LTASLICLGKTGKTEGRRNYVKWEIGGRFFTGMVD